MPSLRTIALAVLLSLTVVGVAAADGSERLVVLYVNSLGQWDRGVQDQWDSAGTVSARGVNVVPWTQAFAPSFIGKLKPAQRDAVLRFPELLVKAARCREIFAVRYVVLERYRDAGRGQTTPVLYDLVEGSHVTLREITQTDLKASRESLSERLREGLAGNGSAVWGHLPAKVYHVVDCDHVRADETIVIKSEREASRNGYEACAICFRQEEERTRTEGALGRQVAAFIERRFTVETDTERAARVERVGRELVDANALTGFNYVFRVLVDDEPNAFATGDGIVYVTSGLETLTAGNDGMLAAVLGHQLGHTEKRHVLRQYRSNKAIATLGTIFTVVTLTYVPDSYDHDDLLGDVIDGGNEPGFEHEADRLRVIYTYEAGYGPDDFMLVVEALQQTSTGKTLRTWLVDHPTEDKRPVKTRAVTGQLQSLDQVAAQYAAVDRGMATCIKRHAVFFLDRQKELSRNLPTFTAALGPAASDVPKTTVPTSDGTPTRPPAGRGDGGIGTPSRPTPRDGTPPKPSN